MGSGTPLSLRLAPRLKRGIVADHQVGIRAGTSYDVVTVNATAPIAMQAMACNGLWTSFTAVPIAGTVTNITGTVA